MASVSVARSNVRKLLESSPAYRALPPDMRRDIAYNTVRAASYMADPNGLLSKKPRVATMRAPKKGARARGPAAAHLAVLCDPRVLDTSVAAAALLRQVDFPEFVGDRIQGTFNAIVHASIEQMKVYRKLVEQVAKTVDRFKEDSIIDARLIGHDPYANLERLLTQPASRVQDLLPHHWQLSNRLLDH